MTDQQFCVPERLLKEREYGRRDPIRHEKKSVSKGSHDKGRSQEKKSLPAASIYGSDIQHEEDNEVYENVLTVVGILPHQLKELRSWFQKHGVEPQFDPPIGAGQSAQSIRTKSRGNWVHLIFDEQVTSYDFITPTIQLTDRIIVTCFIGYFQRGKCYPVPAQRESDVGESQNVMIFKQLKKTRDNWVNLPMEEKSTLNKVREFVFGTREIPKEKSTVSMMIQSGWEKTGLSYAWDRYVIDPLFR